LPAPAIGRRRLMRVRLFLDTFAAEVLLAAASRWPPTHFALCRSDLSYVRLRHATSVKKSRTVSIVPPEAIVLADEFGSRRGRSVRLLTPNGNDFADRFPLIADAIEAPPVRSCVVDEEAIVCDGDGLAVDLIRSNRSDEHE
jgi:hypothetical protein